MINTGTVNKYLEENGKEPDTGYLLKDAGEGNFVAKWDYDDLAEPTNAQLVVYVSELNAEKAAELVTRKRRREYDPIPDQLDAIYKGFEQLSADGVLLPIETLGWMERTKDVKDRNPKPEA